MTIRQINITGSLKAETYPCFAWWIVITFTRHANASLILDLKENPLLSYPITMDALLPALMKQKR